MKLDLTAIIHNVGPIKPLTKGFQQHIVLNVPEKKDEFGDVTVKENFFRIEIWSKTQTDSRFLDSRALQQKRTAKLYLNGERWLPSGSSEFAYNNKLKLVEWV